MSHRAGTLQQVNPAIVIGPDSLAAPDAPNTWVKDFSPTPAPGGTRFVILHFTAGSFPANNKLVVNLGWGENDEFTSADGNDFWTRPVKLSAAGTVTIQYITSGSNNGSVTLSEYGRGEEMISGMPAQSYDYNKTNPDFFLLSGSYAEPFYETRGLCTAVPNWSNVDCLPDPDIRRTTARSCCVIVSIHPPENGNPPSVSTCSGTLIAADLVLTAGHCMSDPDGQEEASSSVCFDFQTDCAGNATVPYNPRFFKVLKIVRRKYPATGSIDYCIMQIKVPPGGIGIDPIPMRSSLPGIGDPVFLIHHPQGVVKKVSAAVASAWSTVSNVILNDPYPYYYVYANTDLTGGSSGSTLFDNTGKILGIADLAAGCTNGFLSVTEVLKDIANEFPATPQRDVMLVVDRSGSMSMSAGTGNTKIEEARDAASLFVQLVERNAGHKMGLVSFSTAVSNPIDFDLTNFNTGARNALIGNMPPFSGGVVGNLIADGLTTIGGGLEAARLQFPVAGANQRTILLLTDGLQNTPPMIETVAPGLSGIDVNVIGFGTEASLNGILLNQLAQQHNGMYTRAGDPLNLKKFFAMAFGNIFESGTLLDPEFILPANQTEAKPIPFMVCSEDTITVVLGWDNEQSPLYIRLKTPSGQLIGPGSAGTDSSNGKTWTFMKVALPYQGDRDGSWSVIVARAGGGEFPPPRHDQRYFINITVKGGPVLNLLSQQKRYYTGNSYQPLIQLVNQDGTVPHHAKVRLIVQRPQGSLGNILSKSGLSPAADINADTIPSRQATLTKIERETGKPVLEYTEETHELYDDGMHHDGAMEPDGIFGDIFRDLLRTEGNYSFRALATYGHSCEGTRELCWSIYVDSGIDAGKTGITTQVVAALPDGKNRVKIILTPRDVYGNNLGPGRGGDLVVAGTNGTIVSGNVTDKSDGTYEIIAMWDSAVGNPPGVVVTQPGRTPVAIAEPCTSFAAPKSKWKWWFFILLIILLVVLAILLFGK